jgi:hypothetical protein
VGKRKKPIKSTIGFWKFLGAGTGIKPVEELAGVVLREQQVEHLQA